MREREGIQDHGGDVGDDDGAMPPLLSKALPSACAATMRAVLACRRGSMLDVVALADRLGDDRRGALDSLDRAERAFQKVFGVPLLSPHRPWFEDAAADADEAAGMEAGGDEGGPDRVALSKALVDLLDVPPKPCRRTGPAPPVDGDVGVWIAALAGSTGRRSGMHLALRTRCDGGRGMDDFVALLDDAGVAATRIDADGRELAYELLRVELHLAAHPRLVLVAPERLLEPEPARPDPEDWAPAPAPPAGSPTSFVRGALPWLAAVRGVCVWCVDADALVPAELYGLVAACVGPIEPRREWALEQVAQALAGAGPAGVAAIAASLGDARDVGARARAVHGVAATGLAIDDACRFVARSFAPGVEPVAQEAAFDLELHSHDGEIALLFERARDVAANGGRLLFHGPPGGGKSTIARALAARMARGGASGPAIVVTAASILARAYGATERLLEALWRRAEIARSPLVIDELDAMCGVRDPSSSGGNAYLVRVLTDEWLRRFDSHPDVPVLASCNSPDAIDPAVLRRFSAHHRIGDELPPRLERRAWTSILALDPPQGWSPCGASPADFATALKRCRMLGLAGAAAHADAVVKARDARRGPRRAPTRPGGLVH